jgi:hypothetical protein
MSRSARLWAVVLSALLALTVLAGCGSDDSRSGGSGGKVVAEKDSSGTPTVDVTFKGDKVTPQGASVKVKAGDPLKLHISADKAGEIHVHSSPEQEIEYGAGTTDKTLTLDQPGVVDVESHSLDKLIFQLEVR